MPDYDYSLTAPEAENLFWIATAVPALQLVPEDSRELWTFSVAAAKNFEKYAVDEESPHFMENWGPSRGYAECIDAYAALMLSSIFGDGSEAMRSAVEYAIEQAPDLPEQEILDDAITLCRIHAPEQFRKALFAGSVTE